MTESGFSFRNYFRLKKGTLEFGCCVYACKMEFGSILGSFGLNLNAKTSNEMDFVAIKVCNDCMAKWVESLTFYT